MKRLIPLAATTLVTTLATTVVTTLAMTLALLIPATTAQAVPAGGAGANTPGTTARVSSSSVPLGAAIRFTLTGFPAGEVVYVKIDDGQTCSSSSVHGACVVHQQRLDARGSASGTVVLPPDVAAGKHWLRFLASQEVAGGGGGVKGYTARTATFTVTASAPAAEARSTAPATPATTRTTGAAAADPSTAGPLAQAAAVPTAGAILHLSPPKPQATVTVTAQPSAATATSDPAAAPVAAPVAASVAEQGGEDRLPYVGIGGLALLLACAAGLLVRRISQARA